MADQKPAQKPDVDRELIRELAKLLDETDLTEIEIERDGTRVRVARGREISHVVGAAATPCAPPRIAAPAARRRPIPPIIPAS